MTEEYQEKLTAYIISMSVFDGMLHKGIITAQEYAKIDTIIAKKHGVNSDTIFRFSSG